MRNLRLILPAAALSLAPHLMQSQPPTLTPERQAAPGLASAMEWGGPVEEQGIRDAARQQSAMQAEYLIAAARDRRAVGMLLTPAQRAQLPQLESAEILKAVRGGAK